MSKMKDMTVGNPLWQILTFSAPLFAMNLLYLSYAVVNTYVAGNTLGPAALAAIGSAMGGLHYCVFGFFSGMTSGFTVVTGQRFGAKDMANVRRSIGTSFILCACISLPLLMLAGMGAKGALQLLRTPPEVIGNATMYLRILFFFSFLNIMHLLLNSILRALGDSKTPLYFSIYGTLANIGMNLLLVLYFKLGVAGVAWATIFSQSTAAIFCTAYALWKMPILRLKKEDLRMDWRFSWEHLRIALPMALQFSVTSVGMVVLQWAVNDFGPDALGGDLCHRAAGIINDHASVFHWCRDRDFCRPELRRTESCTDPGGCPEDRLCGILFYPCDQYPDVYFCGTAGGYLCEG